MSNHARVVLVSGAAGAGKSTIARRLGETLGWPVLDRDDLKDVMFDTLGWSDREWSRKIGAASYELLFMLTEKFVAARVSLVVETNFGPPSAPSLRRIIDVAGGRWVEVFVHADPEVCAERMAKRLRDGGRHPGHNPGASTAADYRPDGRLIAPTGAITTVFDIDTTDDTQPDLAAVVAAVS